MTEFSLNEKENANASAWIEQHKKDHVVNYSGAIGGRWVYKFIPTSIGIIKKVECNGCGENKDITDFEDF